MKEIVNEVVHINAPASLVWDFISDIEHCATWLTNVDSVSILKRGDNGLVGLRWEETRKMFGKEATETMWITRAEPLNFYQVEAHNHGAKYFSKLSIQVKPGGCELAMSFSAKAVSFSAKLSSLLMAPLMKSSVKKMVAKDLSDIKHAAEQQAEAA